MRKLFAFSVVAAIFALAARAPAAAVFLDTFNGENGGNGTLNDYSLANWNVTHGSVDLIGNGYYDFLPGNGLYIDLDGSTNQAGTMVSHGIALAAGSYLFQFDLAGSQRGSLEPVTASVSLGSSVLNSQLFNLPSAQGFTQYDLAFTMASAGSVNLGFAETGGSNMGELLDNVGIETASAGAPLPSAAWGGLVLMGAMLLLSKIRKRRAVCLARVY